MRGYKLLLAAAAGVVYLAASNAGRPWDLVYTQGERILLLPRAGAPRVLTAGFASATDPAVSFDGKRILFAGKRTAAEQYNIFEMNADGTAVRQITRDLGNCHHPIYQPPIFYLDDPRPMAQIAFTSDEPEATELYSARLDGSGVRRLTYVPDGASDPAMLPDGRMLFSAKNPRGVIQLYAINIDGTDFATFSGEQGRDKRMAVVTAKRQVVFVESGGALGTIDLRRNLHSYKPLAEGKFTTPSPLPDGTVLVSRLGESRRFEIVQLDPATGTIVPVHRGTGDATQAQALVARSVPDGRSSVVDEKTPWSKLYCLNLYESDQEIPQGTVKRVRILEGTAAGKRFIGEFDVEEDGSFNVQVPPNTPVQIQTLDKNGAALRTSAWLWTKNKESRGCIGCHEDGERTPENAMAKALNKPSVDLMLPPALRRTVDFEHDVKPVVASKCASCHNSKAKLNLTGAQAYEALVKFVHPGSARTSPLTAAPMPPAGAAALTEMEKRAIVEWIDLGAQRGAR